MRRLLRFVTIFMVTMTVLMPLLECFDRWDGPGLGNDTELPFFLVTLFITLVILVAAAIARRLMDRQNAQTEIGIVYEFVQSECGCWSDIVISPFVSPPLRI
ncbi:MAG TPA: hypothetical protein VFW30_08605 [Bryocella sp.]|nr:hypothetical protein [Bryocella sp.]